MDNRTLKAYIFELKDVEGLSYQAIADRLAEDYGIVRSKQAIQGLYTRTIKRAQTNSCKPSVLAVSDIVNIHALGYSGAETLVLVNSMGYGVTYDNVLDIIRDEAEYIKSVEEANIKKVREALEVAEDGLGLNYILVYKGITAKEKKLKKFIVKAYDQIIIEKNKEILTRAIQIVDDRSVIRQIIQDMHLDITVGDVPVM